MLSTYSTQYLHDTQLYTRYPTLYRIQFVVMQLPHVLVIKIALMAEPEDLVSMYACAKSMKELETHVAALKNKKRILVASIMRSVHSKNILYHPRHRCEIDTYVKLLNILGLSVDKDDKVKLHAIDDLRWLLNRLPISKLELIYDSL